MGLDDLAKLAALPNIWSLAATVLLPTLVVFCVAPGLALNLALLLYPAGHVRRKELLAELKAVPRWERLFWVGEVVAGIPFEALPMRRASRRKRTRWTRFLHVAKEAGWTVGYTSDGKSATLTRRYMPTDGERWVRGDVLTFIVSLDDDDEGMPPDLPYTL